MLNSELFLEYRKHRDDIDVIFENENKNKSIHVIWSGGCDSTLVLHDILQSLKSNKDRRTVHTYNFTHHQLGEKVNYERTRRMMYLNYISDKKFNNVDNKEIALNEHTIELGDYGGGNCPQPAIWLTQIFPIVPQDSILFSGYHRGDDFFTADIWLQWWNVFEGLRMLYGKDVLFMTPLKQRTKIQILEKLIRNDIYNYTWYCEHPDEKGKCGRCTPCETHEMAMLYINKKKEELEIKYGKDYDKEEELVKEILVKENEKITN